MNEQDIWAGLTDIFHDIFDDDSLELRTNMTAADVPEWDSFANINIIVASEIRFGVKFTTSEIEKLANVGELVSSIKNKLGI